MSMNQLNLPNFNSNQNTLEFKRFEKKTELPLLPEGYPISAKVIADSYFNSPESRIVTFELEFPRYILAEFNTHRAFSRNASSSRAIPTKRAIEAAERIVLPVRFGMNKPGMQADKKDLEGENYRKALSLWSQLAEYTKVISAQLSELGLHKQWASRPLEWFSTIRVVMTSTLPGLENFFLLRDHPEAQDEICYLAQAIKDAMNSSTPIKKSRGEWHLPYITDEDLAKLGLENALKVSCARCARTSYKTHHGTTSTLEDDVLLFNKLVHNLNNPEDPFHASPTEHQATPSLLSYKADILTGNFIGWEQYRKRLELKIIP